MALTHTGSVVENGNGINLYIPPEIVADSQWPVTSREYQLRVIPNQAVVFVDTQTRLDDVFPLDPRL